jgi:hypothetical protein
LQQYFDAATPRPSQADIRDGTSPFRSRCSIALLLATSQIPVAFILDHESAGYAHAHQPINLIGKNDDAPGADPLERMVLRI